MVEAESGCCERNKRKSGVVSDMHQEVIILKAEEIRQGKRAREEKEREKQQAEEQKRQQIEERKSEEMKQQQVVEQKNKELKKNHNDSPLVY